MDSSTRIRVLFQTGEQEFRKFYWVELKNMDLYWGPSRKVASEDAIISFSDPDILNITIPETLEFSKKMDSKFSYHESGKVHFKKVLPAETPIYENHSTWKSKEEIKGLTRFFAIITMPILGYPLYNKNISSGGTKAFIIKSEPYSLNERYYMEFFISTKGTFNFPPSLLEGRLTVSQQIKLNEELSLVIGIGNFKGIENWHADKEITITPPTI